MGCHAHFENSHKQNVCLVEEKGALDEKQNCITCHMPKIKGSATTIKITKKHTFHGFAGVRNKPKMLAKYLTFDLKQTINGFDIIVKNLAPHNLLMHPLRLAQLKVRVTKGKKTIHLKPTSFVRILGKDNKPAMPWDAVEIFKDNMLKAKESRTIKYDTILKPSDIVQIEFGYYLVNPALHKKLNLLKNKEATKFYILKTQSLKI
jgi:hypothetical protein